jgi:hypothetical protein
VRRFSAAAPYNAFAAVLYLFLLYSLRTAAVEAVCSFYPNAKNLAPHLAAGQKQPEHVRRLLPPSLAASADAPKEFTKFGL